jgi:DNA-directed RNA polymerase subunit D
MSEENIFEFTIDNIDCSIVNSLRKIIISQIPSIVIDTVQIQTNDSYYCDEMICNRLGLIPLKIENDSTITNFSLELEETGPKTVYSGDIKFSDGIVPVSKDIIILKLNNSETIKLRGNTEEGTALENSKWSVSCGTSYKKISDNSFIFRVETTGCIQARDAFIKSISILKEELSNYKKMVQ